MRGLNCNWRFGSELGPPQRLVQVQGLVRMTTGDSAKATFYSVLLPNKPCKRYTPTEVTWTCEWTWAPRSKFWSQQSLDMRNL